MRFSNNRWWWVFVVLLVPAVVLDTIDGEPLKLATSAMLLGGALIGALSKPPRAVVARGSIAALIIGAIGMIVYRAVGPGL